MMLSAAEYFGAPWHDASDAGSTATVSTEPPSPLKNVETQAVGAWYQHPGIAVFGVVLGAGLLVAHSSKPVARASAKGQIGGAHAGIEGEI